MANVTVLEVSLYGEPIGTLTLLPGDQTLFAFHQDYIDNPKRPTLSLSFKDLLGGTDYRNPADAHPGAAVFLEPAAGRSAAGISRAQGRCPSRPGILSLMDARS